MKAVCENNCEMSCAMDRYSITWQFQAAYCCLLDGGVSWKRNQEAFKGL